jgi:hypothetical protein
MKEKILEQLKIARGKNTSITDRSLEELAGSILFAGVTEETGIAAAIEQAKPILATMEGNTNFTAAQAATKAVDDYKLANPIVAPIVPPIPPIPPTPPVSAAPDWFKEHLEAQAKKDLLVTGKLEGIEKAKQTETLVAQAKTDFYTKYQVSAAEKPLCEQSLDIHLKLNPSPESAEKIIEGWKGQYEGIRSASGMGGLEPVGSRVDLENTAGKASLQSFKETLISSGKIPDVKKE